MGTIKIYGTMKSGGVSSWYEITGAPTTLAGYGITDASNISLTNFVAANSATWGTGGGGNSELNTFVAANSASWAAVPAFSEITSKPTTLAGYGITDDVALNSTVATASANAITSANSYANSNFIPLSGGTIAGSLSVLGALTYIDTNVAVTSAMYIDTSSSETALRVTQSGTGDAIRVEDSANPDTTPFIVKSDGLVGIGTASPSEQLTVNGNVAADVYKVTVNAVNAQATSYVLTTADNGKVITMNSSSALTVSVPSGLGAGFSTTVIQLGTGQVTVSAGAGVTMNSYLGYTKTAGQHAGVSLIAYLANTFNLNGNLA